MQNLKIVWLFIFSLPLLLQAAVSPKVSCYARDLRMVNMSDSMAIPKKEKRDQWEKAGWHAHTVLSVRLNGVIYENPLNSGTFGLLRGSVKTKDMQDIQRFGRGRYWLVFPHAEWGRESGDYSSDYRSWPMPSSHTVSWTFQIKTTQPEIMAKGSIAISLDGIYEINVTDIGHKKFYRESAYLPERRSGFMLLDVDKRKQYTYDELATVKFGMDGKRVRTFKWVWGKRRAPVYDAPVVSEADMSIEHKEKHPLPAIPKKREVQEVPAADFIPDPPRDPNNKFGKPPAF